MNIHPRKSLKKLNVLHHQMSGESQIEKINVKCSNLKDDFEPDKWKLVEYYPKFSLKCIFTSSDNLKNYKFFQNTKFEPFVAFTFYKDEQSKNYFVFCCQEMLAAINIEDNSDTSLFPLLELISSVFLNPTNPDDLVKLNQHMKKKKDSPYFIRINHDDSFEEITNFMKFYNENLVLEETENFSLSTFFKITIKTAMLFFIRRNYFPSFVFIDKSFLATPSEKKKMLKKNNFNFSEFVFLRNLQKQKWSYESLYLHVETGFLFSIKSYYSDDDSNKLFQQEVLVYSKVFCQFIRPYFGYIEADPSRDIGNSLVLEFMSNGPSNEFLKEKKKLDDYMKSKVIIETLLALDTLNAYGYIITNFYENNVLFDHDTNSYLSNFEFVKELDYSQVSVKLYMQQVKYYGNFLKDVGGEKFPSNESGPIVHLYDVCTANTQDEIPTFFSLLYMLKQKKMFFSWVYKDEIYDFLKNHFNTQILEDRDDIDFLYKRSSLSDYNAYYILGTMFYCGFFFPISINQAINLWKKATPKSLPATFKLAKYFEHVNVSGYLTMISSLASSGHVMSQAYLGKHFLKKNSQDYNPTKGFEWLMIAANNNSPEALYKLGKIYEEGEIIKTDLKEALNYYSKASDLFFHASDYEIGRFYYHGIGVERNIEKAFLYLTRAWRSGINEAACLLADIYKKGCISSLSPEENKKKYLALLVAAGNKRNIKAMRKIYKMAFNESSKYDEQSLSFLKQALSMQDPKSFALLAEMTRIGNLVQQDEVKAIEYYKKAADLGNLRSMLKIGEYFINKGKYEIGLSYIKLTAKKNYPSSKLFLGLLYLDGKVLPQNIPRGISLICSSLYQSLNAAYEQLGLMYMENNYFKENDQLSFLYLSHVYNCGYINVQYYLGVMYEEGIYVPKNKEKAYELYKKSCIFNTHSLIRLATMTLLNTFNQNNTENNKNKKSKNAKTTKANNKASQITPNSQNVLKAVEFLNVASNVNNINRINGEILKYIERGYYKDVKNEKILWCLTNQIEDNESFEAVTYQAKMVKEGLNSKVDPDPVKAFKLYKKAAYHENSEAMFQVGKCYEEGIGVKKKDLEAAFRWYKGAASHEHIEASYNVGRMLLNGIGTQKNKVGAFKYLTYAADNNNIDAQTDLAYLYFELKEYKKAYKYCLEASTAGNPRAIVLLSKFYYNGYCVEKNITRFLNYLLQCDHFSNAEAQYTLGSYYENEVSDMNRAFHWYSRAAHNNTNAVYKVAQMLYEGIGINKDVKQAYKWFKLAANNGNLPSMMILAQDYLEGNIDSAEDNNFAINFLKKAAENGNSSAMYTYGCLIEKPNDRYIKTDYEEAQEWFLLSSKCGNNDAFAKVINLYSNGLHLKNLPILNDLHSMLDFGDKHSQFNGDFSLANNYYQKAAERAANSELYKLGVSYENPGFSKPPSNFEESAKSGNLAGMIFLADNYRKENQLKNALFWYEKCSQAGLTHATVVVGKMYCEGHGTAIDKIKARQYFKQAADNGSSEAKFEIAKLMLEDHTPNFMNIINLLIEASEGECGDAMNMLGLMYKEGIGVSIDNNHAKIWFERGSNIDNIQSMLNLAKLYYDAPNRNINTVIKLLTKASDEGSIIAKLNLAKIYKRGKDVSKDEVRAGKLYLEVAELEKLEETEEGLEDLYHAASCKNPAACSIIGSRYMKGIDEVFVENHDDSLIITFCPIGSSVIKREVYQAQMKNQKNTKKHNNSFIDFEDEDLQKKAFILFQIGARAKIIKSLVNLGRIYENGLGVQKSIDKAIRYYKEAADEGYEKAARLLHHLSPDTRVKKVDECSFFKSGERLIQMHSFECITCEQMFDSPICLRCAMVCHKGHKLIDVGMRSNTFCHCECHLTFK